MQANGFFTLTNLAEVPAEWRTRQDLIDQFRESPSGVLLIAVLEEREGIFLFRHWPHAVYDTLHYCWADALGQAQDEFGPIGTWYAVPADVPDPYGYTLNGAAGKVPLVSIADPLALLGKGN